MARKAKTPHSPWDEARETFKQQFKDLSAALQAYRERAGKPAHPHLFSNEVRLIKRLVNGGSDQIAPDDMTLEQLAHACILLSKDVELLHTDHDYRDRKATLQSLLLGAAISEDHHLAQPSYSAGAANDSVPGSLL